MPDAPTQKKDVEQQALAALGFLNDEDKSKVLEYIASLIKLEKVKNDQASTS